VSRPPTSSHSGTPQSYARRQHGRNAGMAVPAAALTQLSTAFDRA
jgi:hypothetical protein